MRESIKNSAYKEILAIYTYYTTVRECPKAPLNEEAFVFYMGIF